MSNETLAYNWQQEAERLSLVHWGEACHIPIVWNGRLKRTMGRFLFKQTKQKRTPLKIELSTTAATLLSVEQMRKVLLHELCHYHLFIQNRPFTDRHPVFEAEIKRVQTISTNEVSLPRSGYALYCSQCAKFLGHRVRFNTRNYRSLCCKAKIIKTTASLGKFSFPQ